MINKKFGLIALLAGLAAGEAVASTVGSTLTSYVNGDVLLCFRNANDLVVDVGQISSLTNGVVPNQRIPITQFTGTQLNDIGGVDGVSWSAFTWLTNDDSLFVTKARTVSINVQSTPWHDSSDPSQSSTAAFMAKIPPGAVDELNALFSADSTSTAVIEEDKSDGNQNYIHGISYKSALGSGLNFNTTFQGNPENTTPGTFSSSGGVVRSDLYRLTPVGGFGQPPAVLLGYFELGSDGTMAYVAYPSAAPVIKTISRSGTSTTITYTAGLYGTYTLRGTNSLSSGTASANWPAISTLTSGDTATHSTTFTDSNDTEFYTITAQ